MKRLLSLALSILMILSSAVIVSAADMEVTASVLVDDITVTVTGGKTTNTLKVYQLVEDADGAFSGDDGSKYSTGNIIYIGETKSGTFNFKFKNNDTASYVAIVNNNRTNYDVFHYVNTENLISFCNSLAAATASDAVKAAMIAGDTANSITFDTGKYFDYVAAEAGSAESAVVPYINKGIIALELPTIDAASTTLNEDLTAYTTKIADGLTKLLASATFVLTDVTDFDAVVKSHIANEETFNLDGKYYATKSGSVWTEIADPVRVQGYFAKIEKASFDAEDVAASFDEAVMLALLNDADAQTVLDALSYFDAKDWLTLPTLEVALSEEEEIDLANKLKEGAINGTIKSAADIETYYSEYAPGATEGEEGEEEEESTTIGGNSTIGGFAGGSSMGASKPTTKPEDETTDPVIPEDGNFADLEDADWAKENIVRLAKAGIINGKGDGKFYPNDLVSREEFVKIIVTGFGLSDDTARIDFADVAADRWSYQYIASANKAGLINGVTDDAFSPDGKLSREGMAVIMYRLAEKLGLELKASEEEFTDGDAIADYAKDAVSALFGSGIINGMGDGTFAPTATVTRAQAAKIVCSLLDAVGGAAK